MKGLLYCDLLLNKKWFLGAGIAAVLGTVLFTVLYSNMKDNMVIMFAYVAVQVVVLALSTEWLGRNLESNIKCRFADYALASGISKNAFVLTELAKNIVSILIGFAMCILIQLVMLTQDSCFLTENTVKLLFSFTLFIGMVNWIISPLIINFRNAEKASLFVGIILSFGAIIPITIAAVNNSDSDDIMVSLIELINRSWFFPAVLGVIAAVYGIVYVLFLNRIKRGDVC